MAPDQRHGADRAHEAKRREAPSSPPRREEKDAALIAIARIVRPRGRRGEVEAEILTDFPARFGERREVFLEGPETPLRAQVEEVWLHKGRVVFKFQGVDSISQAETLRGRHVLIPREERAALADHQYYVADLEGCSVLRESESGPEIVGKVEQVERTPGGELLHVRTPEGEVLIPFAREICRRVDLAARVIVIEPPEDLLELNRPGAGRDGT